MMTRPITGGVRIAIILLLVCGALLSSAMPALADTLPAGVTSRLKKIDQYMTNVEKALENKRVNRNDLERAQNALGEITKQYPDNANADEVRAAGDRIARGAAAIAQLEKEQAEAKEKAANAARNAEALAEQWADRMAPYHADTTDGAKGNFGVPMSEPARIVALAPLYQEARALYAEFLATGIDKDAHWKLRQAENDIKVAIANYEASIERLVQEAAAHVEEARTWQAAQLPLPAPLLLPSDRMAGLRSEVAGVRLMLPADHPRLAEIVANLTTLEQAYAGVEAIQLKQRRMKPAIYKGTDQGALNALASSIVMKAESKAKVLRTHIIQAAWTTEAVEEWTDTTKTARQVRVTRGITVQVAALIGEDCVLYTLFIHQDTIGGVKRPLTGHVMYRDKFLRENLPK